MRTPSPVRGPITLEEKIRIRRARVRKWRKFYRLCGKRASVDSGWYGRVMSFGGSAYMARLEYKRRMDSLVIFLLSVEAQLERDEEVARGRKTDE